MKASSKILTVLTTAALLLGISGQSFAIDKCYVEQRGNELVNVDSDQYVTWRGFPETMVAGSGKLNPRWICQSALPFTCAIYTPTCRLVGTYDSGSKAEYNCACE